MKNIIENMVEMKVYSTNIWKIKINQILMAFSMKQTIEKMMGKNREKNLIVIQTWNQLDRLKILKKHWKYFRVKRLAKIVKLELMPMDFLKGSEVQMEKVNLSDLIY